MPGILRGVARTAVIAGTATAVSNRVSRRQQGRWARQEEQAYQQQWPLAAPAPGAAQAGSPAAAPPEDDMTRKLAQLNELGQLKTQGVLTEEEFEAQKRQILAS